MYQADHDPHPNGRNKRRLVRVALALVLGGVAATAGYGFMVEPNRIEVTHHQLPGQQLKKAVKIAHITDLHTRGFGAREQTVVALLRAENPDVILVTGDTVDEGTLAPARDFFANLSAPLGVFVVRGNWERWGVRESEAAFYKTLGVHFLENSGVAVRDDLWIGGLDDPATGEPDARRALESAPPAAYKIMLFHAPDYFREVAGLFNLALAGHTHGGQVFLPGIGPLWLPEGGKRYVRGWFTENGSHLFVSRGIGTSRAPIRLFARPELAIIELRPG